MGQSVSTPGYCSGSSDHRYLDPAATCQRTLLKDSSFRESMKPDVRDDDRGHVDSSDCDGRDYSWGIPDECLALIFQFLSSGSDRKSCSLVCRRWFRVESQSRHRLSLKAQVDILPHISSIFSRFDSVTKLALRCSRKRSSISDEGLVLISVHCRNLTRLKLRGCRDITEVGLAGFAKNCTSLKKFSCGSCMFGSKGLNALLDHCSSLEELSVKRLCGFDDGVGILPIGPGAAASSLRSICLKELYNGQCFGPLIIGSKNLKSLKVIRSLGDWDRVLEAIGNSKNSLVEVHLERLQMSDVGLIAVSNCLELEILHLVKASECTNAGVVAVAERCKMLRKFHIDGWRINRINDEALVAIGKNSLNLQELVLIGLNPTIVGLSAIASNCQKLERLALCGSETIADAEVSCIAEKCLALRKLCIKGCNVSDQGMEAFGLGCPNLVKIKVKKCKKVSSEIGHWLRARRRLLVVNLDAVETEAEAADASMSDGGAQDDSMEFPPNVTALSENVAADSTRNANRSTVTKTRFGLFGRRGSLSGCTFPRRSGDPGSSSGS